MKKFYNFGAWYRILTWCECVQGIFLVGIVEVFMSHVPLELDITYISIGMFDMWKLQIAPSPSYERSMVAQW